MTEPRRILDDDPDELDLLLLGAGTEEAPSSRAKQRTLLALGLAVGTAALGAKVGTGLTGGKAVGSLPVALFAKLTGVGVVAGGLAVGAAAVFTSMSEEPTARNTPAVSAWLQEPSSTPVASASTVSASEEEGLEAPPTVASAERKVRLAPAEPAPRVPVPVESSEPAPTNALAEELDLVERARAHLQAGRARDALRLLDRRDADHPRGVLGIEATVLRVEALVQLGDRAAARSIGEAFLKRHPRSPLAPRVRQAVGRVPSKAEGEPR